ncbi:MAG: hypothetical protein ABUS57_21925 [Pseudomonadota bacterium]
MIAVIAAGGASFLLAAAIARLLMGPTLWDRALAVQSALLKLVIVVAALALLAGRADWLDMSFALLFGLVVFNLAALKLYRMRTFQAPLTGKGAMR